MALKTADVLYAIKEDRDVSGIIVDKALIQSAVAPLAQRVTMNAPSLTTMSLGAVEAHFIDHTETKFSQELTASTVSLNVKPLATVMVFDKYLNEDVRSFTARLRERISEAFAKAMDREMLYNTDAKFTRGVVAAATAAGHVKATQSDSLYDNLNTVMGYIEADAYEPSGFVLRINERSAIRAAKDANNLPIFSMSAREGEPDRLLGLPTYYTRNTQGTTRAVVGQWNQLIYGVYDQLAIDTFDTGVVTVGATTYNLLQQNLIAIRAEMRLGFTVVSGDAFAVLTT